MTVLEMAERSGPVRMSSHALADVSFQFTKVFYVKASGSDDNSGESWEFPFRTIWAAVEAAGSLSTDFTLIHLSADDHRINQVDPTIDKQVYLRGALNGLTSLYNDAGAGEILKFTKHCGLEAVELYLDGAQDGLVISTALAFHCHLENVEIDCRSATGAHDGIRIEQVSELHILHIHIFGDKTLTTGLHLDEAINHHIKDVYIEESLIGVHIENAASTGNQFIEVEFHHCATGIQVDAGDENLFTRVSLLGCTTNIDDNGTHTDFVSVATDELDVSIAPDDLTGVTVTAGGAGAWGGVAEIRAAASATKPFYVSGVTYELSQQERYQIRLSDDGGTTYFWSVILEERTANRTKFQTFAKPIWIRQGSAITAYVRSETGGNTCITWIHIIVI